MKKVPVQTSKKSKSRKSKKSQKKSSKSRESPPSEPPSKSRGKSSTDRKKVSKKQKTPVSVTEVKQRRHLSVVGGTDTAPSLRELKQHRNRKKPLKGEQAAKERSNPMVQQASMPSDRCDLCAKVQEQWVQSDGLRKKTIYSDVILHTSDGDTFYANTFVLAVCSKTLLTEAEVIKSGSGKETWKVEVDGFPGEIMHAVLRFMYGGSVTGLPLKALAVIVNMADTYGMDDVKRGCFVAADVAPLKVASVVAVWEFADEFMLHDASSRAMRFIYTNLERVVTDPDWPRVSHRVDMLLKLLRASAEWTMVNDEWRSWRSDESEIPDTFVEGVRAIWRDSEALSKKHACSDKIIVVKSERQLHIHSQIVHVMAPSFATFLEDEAQATDMNLIYIDDMDDDVVIEFLRFIYRQEPSSAFPQLASLVLVLASTYGVSDLTQMCEREVAVQQVKSIEGALGLLQEAEEHRMSAAKSACFRYLYSNLAEVCQREEWRELIKSEPQLLTEMLLESKRFRSLVKE